MGEIIEIGKFHWDAAWRSFGDCRRRSTLFFRPVGSQRLRALSLL
jgi:hypothetical protein